jgi:hypothetical protein
MRLARAMDDPYWKAKIEAIARGFIENAGMDLPVAKDNRAERGAAAPLSRPIDPRQPGSEAGITDPLFLLAEVKRQKN